MIGQTISHYRILERLGAGGMGEVFLAHDAKLDRKVALKFLPGSLWNEEEAKQRLIREARAASKLDHPNVVTIFGIDEHEGRPFISMAHVQGATLKDYCKSQPRSTTELIDLAIQMADGLQHAHEAGVVHRDLKPSNILVDERGRVKILDFGIASLRGAAKLTQTGSTVGTLAYAPPELALGRTAEPASDIYSLGVVMYQMLSGRLPFEADHEAALLYAILHDQPRPLSEFNSRLSPEIQQVVEKCLNKDPQKRYSSCAELAAELKKSRPLEAGGPAPVKDKPSIAVLPFNNMSADPENEYFSDGLTEELLNVLAKNPELKVTGRTSSFVFKGKREDLREIGQKLGVETLLEGSVRKSGNRVRITAQLVKAKDGFHLWSETYDRVLDDIFAVQDDIARSVSQAMNVALLAGKPITGAARNTESFTLTLQAKHLALRNTQEAMAHSVELYQKALQLDPQNAGAWAGLARAYMMQYSFGHTDDEREQAIPRVRQALSRATTLNPDLPDAYEVLGWLTLDEEFDWKASEAAFRKAYALAPGNAQMAYGLSSLCVCMGNFDEALRLSREAIELDPLNPESHTGHGRNLIMAGRCEEGRDSLHKSLELSPGTATAHNSIGISFVLEGNAEIGLAEIEKEPAAGYRNFGKSIALHALGRKSDSDRALADLKKEGVRWSFQIAAVHAMRGEIDLAYEALEMAYQIRDSGLPLTKVVPLLRNLHADPRWPVFLRKIGWPA